MTWDVLCTEELAAWLPTLTGSQRDAVIARVDLLAAAGPALGLPTVDAVEGSRHPGMKALWAHQDGAIRVLFLLDPHREAVLLVRGEKRGPWKGWFDDAIPIADDLVDEYLSGERSLVGLRQPIEAESVARHRAEAVAEIVTDARNELRRTGTATPDDLTRLLATVQPGAPPVGSGLSTVRRYVEALGGHLEITAIFEDERFPVTLGDDD